MDIYAILKKLEINYDKINHQPVFTIEEAKFIKDKIPGVGVKNLFLKDKQNNFYLVLLKEDEKLDFKEIATKLNVSNLKFAQEKELQEILNISRGSVTPLSIINDKNNKVLLIISKKLINQKILVHPNINTSTINIEYLDLIKFITFYNHNYILY